ncbi:MAG: tripartite tricarboxylate transporter substrate binding protein [Rhizobiales bacterium]|nr:tripartite tricarboxylate transporter substrate binding protein [Hyphomicrobiales bacterium]
MIETRSSVIPEAASQASLRSLRTLAALRLSGTVDRHGRIERRMDSGLSPVGATRNDEGEGGENAMRRFAILVACAIVLLGTVSAQAETYPSKPIRIVVPFVAGGAVDLLARIMGQKLTETLGQPVIVENRPGAGGNTAADMVAKSPPDGYTIFQTTNGLAISPALYRKLPFDPVEDLVPVTQLVASQLLLVATPSLPAKTTAELITLAKAKPGTLNYGMTGVGNPLHLTMEMLMHAAGVKFQAIPYRGDAPLNTALIAGEVQLAVVPFATAKPNIESGRLRALGIAGAKRSPSLPDVPTIAESGVPGFDSTSWQGWFVPAGTPRKVIALIQREAAKALKMPDVRARMDALANEVVGSTPDEFAVRYKADLARFAKIVKDAGIPQQN